MVNVYSQKKYTGASFFFENDISTIKGFSSFRIEINLYSPWRNLWRIDVNVYSQ